MSGDDDPEKLCGVGRESVGDGGEDLSEFSSVPEIDGKSAQRARALCDVSGVYGFGKGQRFPRPKIERKRPFAEPEETENLGFPVRRVRGVKQRCGVLESLHSSSVAAGFPRAYIV